MVPLSICPSPRARRRPSVHPGSAPSVCPLPGDLPGARSRRRGAGLAGGGDAERSHGAASTEEHQPRTRGLSRGCSEPLRTPPSPPRARHHIRTILIPILIRTPPGSVQRPAVRPLRGDVMSRRGGGWSHRRSGDERPRPGGAAPDPLSPRRAPGQGRGERPAAAAAIWRVRPC